MRPTPARAATRCTALSLAVLAAACAHRSPGPASPPIDPGLALQTFDTAWTIVHRTHYDTAFNGVDWVALREELRPRVDSVETRRQLRRIIGGMLERLGQSHFALIPEEAVDSTEPGEGDPGSRTGSSGLEFRVIHDRAVVTRADSGGPAAAEGVRPGWIIVSVGGDRVADLVEAARRMEGQAPLDLRIYARVAGRLGGEPGAEKRIVFLDGSDRERELELTLREAPGQPVKFGNLPTFFSRFASRRVELPSIDGEAGVIWFNFWMVPLVREIDAAVDEYRDLAGMVIDLRGNGGGVGAMVAGVAGHFLDEPISLGTFRTRTTELEIRANPRRVSPDGRRVEPFTGAVAILIDGLTGSASEMFAGGMQAIGRARVFGTTSAGAVLPATMDRLPNGDVLYHAFADFTAADGARLEGRGVVPDQRVALSRADLLAGRDVVLEAALAWIASERTGRPASGVQR